MLKGVKKYNIFLFSSTFGGRESQASAKKGGKGGGGGGGAKVFDGEKFDIYCNPE